MGRGAPEFQSELDTIRFYVGTLETFELKHMNFSTDAALQSKLVEPLQSNKNARADPAHLEIQRAMDNRSMIPFRALVSLFNLAARGKEGGNC